MVPTRISRARYVSLTTYRRSGAAVATPVWACADGGCLYVWTLASSGKVKRIRATGRVTVAPCDVRGRIPEGAVTAEGTGRVLDADGLERVRRLMTVKYGLQFRLIDLSGLFRGGRRKGRVGLELALDPAPEV